MGQIPFAADAYRSYRRQGLSHEKAAALTQKRGAQFAEGNFQKGVGAIMGLYEPDVSNSYDNAMIGRVTEWGQNRYSLHTEKHGRNTIRSIVSDPNHPYGELKY